MQNKLSEQRIQPNLALPWLFMLCTFMVFQLNAVAQHAPVKQTGNELQQAYLEKNKDTQLVQLFHQNSGDALLNQALRLSIILGNPESFPEFNQDVINRMRGELDVMNSDLKQICNYVKENGDTYEVAKARLERYRAEPGNANENAPAMNKQNQMNSSTPSLVVPQN